MSHFGTPINRRTIAHQLKRMHLQRTKANIERAKEAIRKRNKRRRDPTGVDVSGIESAADWQIIYGKARVGGVMTYRQVSTNNQTLWMVFTVAGHEIDRFTKIFFDGEEVSVSTALTTKPTGLVAASGNFTGYAWFQINYGETGQSALSELVSDTASYGTAKWSTNHRQRGRAHIMVKLRWNAELWVNGEPEISFEIKGKKVYDPRSATTAWSANAALCLSDYLMDTTYGLAVPQAKLNNTAWQAAANTCDEDVSLAAGGTEDRYTCNGYFGASESPKNVIDDMLACMGGWMPYVAGQWEILPAIWRSSVVTLDEDDFLGHFTVRAKASRKDSFNRVRGSFVSAEKDYQESDFPLVTNSTYVTEDNSEVVYEDMSFNFVTSGATAQRLGKLALEEIRQGITFSAPLKLRAYQAKAGQNVSITNARMGWSAKTFRLVTITPVADQDANGVTALTVMGQFMESASGVFDWNSGNETTVDVAANTTLPNPAAVGVITSLALASGTTHLFLRDDGTVFTRIYASWTLPTDFFVQSGGKFEIQFKKSSDSDWTDSTPIPGDQAFTYILDVKDTVQYDVRVRCVNALGVRGAWVTSSNHQVVGKTAAPSDVTGFSGVALPNGFQLSWSAITDADAGTYEVRQGGTNWSDATFVQEVKGTRCRTALSAGSSITFRVKAIDTTGNYSTNATSAAVTITPPGAVSLLTSQVVGSVVQLRWVAPSTGTLPVDHYRIYRGSSYAVAVAAGELGRVSGTFKAMPELIGGAYTYWVMPYDLAGNAGTENSVAVTLANPSDYVFYASASVSFSGGTKSSSIYELIGSGGTLVAPVNATETWANHFVNNSWTTPQNQIDAGYPIYIQPNVASGYWTQDFDLGAKIGGSIVKFLYTVSQISGTVQVTPSIATSPDNATWTTYSSTDQAYSTNFRYIRLRLDFARVATTDICRVSSASYQINVQEISDGGFALSNAGSAKTITFNKTFVDIRALTVTAEKNASYPVEAQYVFTDAPNPTTFDVYCYRTDTGAQVANNFSWSADGV